jgi:hypothetical protein
MDPPTQPPTAATRPAIAGSPTTGGIPALFARAIGRPHALRRCIVLLTGLGAAYALSIELLALGGGTPGTAPWLAIPTESYFFVEPAHRPGHRSRCDPRLARGVSACHGVRLPRYLRRHPGRRGTGDLHRHLVLPCPGLRHGAHHGRRAGGRRLVGRRPAQAVTRADPADAAATQDSGRRLPGST